jgi:hypothetical protein
MVSRDPRGEQAGEPDGSTYLRDAVPGGVQLVEADTEKANNKTGPRIPGDTPAHRDQCQPHACHDPYLSATRYFSIFSEQGSGKKNFLSRRIAGRGQDPAVRRG